jgi:phenylpyruvate tautomerase PptA (4-oxalocrotonate tautomerase family)
MTAPPWQTCRFVEAITKATCESLGVEPDSVDIVLTGVKSEKMGDGWTFGPIRPRERRAAFESYLVGFGS